MPPQPVTTVELLDTGVPALSIAHTGRWTLSLDGMDAPLLVVRDRDILSGRTAACRVCGDGETTQRPSHEEEMPMIEVVIWSDIV